MTIIEKGFVCREVVRGPNCLLFLAASRGNGVVQVQSARQKEFVLHDMGIGEWQSVACSDREKVSS